MEKKMLSNAQRNYRENFPKILELIYFTSVTQIHGMCQKCKLPFQKHDKEYKCKKIMQTKIVARLFNIFNFFFCLKPVQEY